MASRRESGNSTDGNINEEKGRDISCTSKRPYAKWLSLGIGPSEEDGLNENIYGKGKEIEKGDAGSSGKSRDGNINEGISCEQPYTNRLTLGFGPFRENGKGKSMGAGSSKDEAEDVDKEGERGRSSNKKLYLVEESMCIDLIPEDIVNIILCKLPLQTLFQSQIICSSWKYIISRSDHFQNVWDQSNRQLWLVMDQYDETRKSSTGLRLFDVSRRKRINKTFDEEWRYSESQWILRAGHGGLLVYSSKQNGILRVMNPLTMQSHSLENARLNEEDRILYYMKRYHDYVSVHLKFDSEEKSYEVILVIGRHLLFQNQKLSVLIYRSAKSKWEKRDVSLDLRANGSMTVQYLPTILVHNKKIYWFSENGVDVGIYDLNADSNSSFVYTFQIPGVLQLHKTLGIVVCKGRIIMVCRMDLALVFYEFDELGLQWRSNYNTLESPHPLHRGVTCVGGDYIWLIQKREGRIIWLDIDAGELNIWPEVYPFMFNVRNCLSMPLRFCPCP